MANVKSVQRKQQNLVIFTHRFKLAILPKRHHVNNRFKYFLRLNWVTV